MSLGLDSNSLCHLTADGPGEFWCPACGARCTRNSSSEIRASRAALVSAARDTPRSVAGA